VTCPVSVVGLGGVGKGAGDTGDVCVGEGVCEGDMAVPLPHADAKIRSGTTQPPRNLFIRASQLREDS
jgi:hypothetical protein